MPDPIERTSWPTAVEVPRQRDANARPSQLDLGSAAVEVAVEEPDLCREPDLLEELDFLEAADRLEAFFETGREIFLVLDERDAVEPRAVDLEFDRDRVGEVVLVAMGKG